MINTVFFAANHTGFDFQNDFVGCAQFQQLDDDLYRPLNLKRDML